jgi:DNA repair exonuclease SbcCD nuclease subunit
LKFVLISDVHLDVPFAWMTVDAARRRRLAIRDVLNRVAAVVTEVKADALVIAGDLYEHDLISPDTETFLRDAFASLSPTPVFIAPGNHDWLGPQSAYRRVPWSPNVHIFSSNRLEPLVIDDGLTIWGAAHLVPANTDGFLDGFHVDRGGIHVALFHGSERGEFTFQEEGKVAHAPFNAWQIAEAGLHHAMVGHYHTPADEPFHTYPGNPDPLTFGESGTRGAVILEVHADGSVDRERRIVAATPAADIAVTLDGCTNATELREHVSHALEGLDGVARVTLTGCIEPTLELHLEDLAAAAPGMLGITVCLGEVHAGYDFDAVAGEQTVRGQFVRDVAAGVADPALRRRVLTTGLRALSGVRDLDVP